MADATQANAQANSSDFDAGFVEPSKSSTFKFGKPGDAIKGVYLGGKPFSGEYGPTVIHSIRAVGGSFHDIVDDVPSATPTALKPGEIYSVFEKGTFSEQIAQAKVGQLVIVRYVEEKAKKNTDGKKKSDRYKLVQCLLGPMSEPTEASLPDFA